MIKVTLMYNNSYFNYTTNSDSSAGCLGNDMILIAEENDIGSQISEISQFHNIPRIQLFHDMLLLSDITSDSIYTYFYSSAAISTGANTEIMLRVNPVLLIM